MILSQDETRIVSSLGWADAGARGPIRERAGIRETTSEEMTADRWILRGAFGESALPGAHLQLLTPPS